MITLKDVLEFDFTPYELMAQDSYIFGHGLGRKINSTTLYTFLTTISESLCAITIALRKHWKQGKGLYMKPVCVHDVECGNAFVKDMMFVGGMFQNYTVDWCDEGMTSKYCYSYGYKYERDRIVGWKNTYIDADKKQKTFNFTAQIANPEFLKETKYKYCGWSNNFYYPLNEYLFLYQLYPQIEYFAKMNEMRLAIPSILSKCEKDKLFIKYLREVAIPEMKGNYRLNPGDIISAYKRGITVSQQANIREFKKDLKNRNLPKIKTENIEKVQNYLIRNKIDCKLYFDYLKAVAGLELNLDDTKNITPKDFMHWHDVRIAEYADKKAMEEEEKQKAKNKKIKDIVALYKQIETSENFVVFMPTTVADFIQEGEMLHHCVGRMGYADRMSRGDTLILFVRKPENKTVPFVTMEYQPSSQRIIQVYGDHDTKPEQSVIDFLNNIWKPKADKICIQVQRKIKKLTSEDKVV